MTILRGRGPSLAKWQCHQIVGAGKITEIYENNRLNVLQVDGSNFAMDVPDGLFKRGVASPGDYLVIYDDGYASWSPATAFEDGHTPIHAPVGDGSG